MLNLALVLFGAVSLIGLLFLLTMNGESDV